MPIRRAALASPRGSGALALLRAAGLDESSSSEGELSAPEQFARAGSGSDPQRCIWALKGAAVGGMNGWPEGLALARGVLSRDATRRACEETRALPPNQQLMYFGELPPWVERLAAAVDDFAATDTACSLFRAARHAAGPLNQVRTCG